jgi:hypothetical protein
MKNLLLRAIVIIIVGTALPAHAGLRYHFTTTTRSGPYESHVSGTMLVGNDSYRLELEPDRTGQREFDIAISRDRDRTAWLVNRARGEVWLRRPAGGRIVSSRLFILPVGFESRVGGEIAVTKSASNGGIIAGVATVKHTINLTYRIYSDLDRSPFTADVHAVINIWTAPSLPPLPLARRVTSSLPQVDAALAAASADIHGMPMRHELTVTRTIENGPAVTESVDTVIDAIAAVAVTPASFNIPTELRERASR